MLKEKFAKPLFESLTDMLYNLQYLEGLMPMGDYMDGFDMVIHFRLRSSFYFMGLQIEYETAYPSAIKSLGETMKPFLSSRVVNVNN